MTESPAAPVLAKLAALRTELVEQAYALERQGRLDAADVVIATSVRLAEIAVELETGGCSPVAAGGLNRFPASGGAGCP
ncbi:MAG TPA: hypothetical protein VGD97_07870 [Lacunisphaera sp.]